MKNRRTTTILLAALLTAAVAQAACITINTGQDNNNPDHLETPTQTSLKSPPPQQEATEPETPQGYDRTVSRLTTAVDRAESGDCQGAIDAARDHIARLKLGHGYAAESSRSHELIGYCQALAGETKAALTSMHHAVWHADKSGANPKRTEKLRQRMNDLRSEAFASSERFEWQLPEHIATNPRIAEHSHSHTAEERQQDTTKPDSDGWAPGTATIIRPLQLPWTGRELNALQRETVDIVTGLESRHDNEEPGGIASMPFLQTWQPEDRSAVKTLAQLYHRSPEDLKEVLDHPTFQDTGISDAWTPVIAAAYAASRHEPARLHEMLKPENTTVESTTIETAHSGRITLHIVRPYGRGRSETMEYLKKAVAHNELVNQEPLPDQTVILVMGDTGHPTVGGINYDTATVINRRYDEQGAVHQPDRAELKRILFHEIAHHYWHGAEVWLAEGMAELIAGSEQHGTFWKEAASCAEEMPLAQRPRYNATTQCHYRLGTALLAKIRDQAGAQPFYDGMKRIRAHDPQSAIGALIAEFPEIKNHADTLQWYYGLPADKGDSQP